MRLYRGKSDYFDGQVRSVSKNESDPRRVTPAIRVVLRANDIIAETRYFSHATDDS